MIYFFFFPYRPQYFFPENFNKYPFSLSLFQPYSLKGRILWIVWRNLFFFRKLFVVNNIENFVPEKLIKSFLNEKTVFAFNIGSPGIERKITALAFDNEGTFFLKFSQKKNVRKMILNEAYILNQLIGLDFVPKVIDLIRRKDFILLITTILVGNRLNDNKLNYDIVGVLLKINSLNIAPKIKISSSTKKVFSHGDFCPWNLMECNGSIRVFDWEMAGEYPLGYDLFTFIYQPAILINSYTNFGLITAQNFDFISNYFDYFDVKDWKPYLVTFALTKYKIEFDKNNSRLYEEYLKLIDFAKKA